jgi:hypothetical protein
MVPELTNEKCLLQLFFYAATLHQIPSINYTEIVKIKITLFFIIFVFLLF